LTAFIARLKSGANIEDDEAIGLLPIGRTAFISKEL
jgi:hypothetical protein